MSLDRRSHTRTAILAAAVMFAGTQTITLAGPVVNTNSHGGVSTNGGGVSSNSHGGVSTNGGYSNTAAKHTHKSKSPASWLISKVKHNKKAHPASH
ncbi:MAG: hypothetical protein JOZ24_05640 [Candidatus Eremiobacteraeota bacterium]|nr:hypothetical protein [Candidatus Eremiobacteraeota bacterium]